MYRCKQINQVAHVLWMYIGLVSFSLPVLYNEEQNSALMFIDEGAFTPSIIKTTRKLTKDTREVWDKNMVSGTHVAQQTRPYSLHFRLPLKIKFSIPF